MVKERSGGCGSVVGLPEQVVVAFAAGYGLSFHLTSLDQDSFPSPVEDGIRAHVAKGFVIAAVVVVVHEAGDG